MHVRVESGVRGEGGVMTYARKTNEREEEVDM